MNDDDRKRLRELAERATPGPWEYVPTGPDRSADFVRAELGSTVADFGGYPPSPADAAFIAAANPTAVLELLDDMEILRAIKDAEVRRGEWRAGALLEACDIAYQAIEDNAAAMPTTASDRIVALRKIF